MADKLYLLSFDKDAGGRRFFFTGTDSSGIKHTTVLGKAKPYKRKINAIKIGRKLCGQLGFRKQILVHEWEPKDFDNPKVVYTI